MTWHEASWKTKLALVSGLIGCLVMLAYGEPDILFDMAITSAMGACVMLGMMPFSQRLRRNGVRRAQPTATAAST